MAFIKCPSCGNDIDAIYYICPHCDYQIRAFNDPSIICGECGCTNDENSNFCKNCGLPLSKSGLDKFEKREDELLLEFFKLFKNVKKTSLKDFFSQIFKSDSEIDEALKEFDKIE